MREQFEQMPNGKKIFTWVIAAVIILVGVFIIKGIAEDADKSKNYVCQMPISGKYHVWTEGGWQWQWFGNVESYNKTSQVEFSGLEKNEHGYVATGKNPAAALTFNDKGKGMIVGSFRVVLPSDEQNMMKIQRDFGSEESLINNLVRPTLYKVVTSCGPLMSSMESVSENRTDLIWFITDQLNDGVYKTRTEKVEVKNELTGEQEKITKAVIIEDQNAPGGYKRQEKSPFSQYGITCGLVSIIDIKYDEATQRQIDAQKEANLAVITSKTQALQAQQKTIQITEEGKAEAERAKWAQEKIKTTEITKAEQQKQVAITQAEQEREVARLAAEKAEFEKKKIIAEGEAQAAANKALVSAGLTPLERATIEKDTKIGIAHELAQSKVQWVPTIITGNNGNGNIAIEALGLNQLMQVIEQMNNSTTPKK